MKHSPPTAAEDLLEIFVRRYEKGAIILTANRPLEDWGQVLGDTAGRRGYPGSLPAPCRGHQTARKKLPNVQPKGTA